ncbi:acyltransferase [Herbaspirillum frisingense]|uniref:acyltransferase family protein n=1 Tax=Herbaspirillum frisingense TaxID=92645 RepID=UPI0015FF5917|nr:acyltransferase [Herbaspirillum frisingense]QNB08318.1 acyltransferase [Herbaspirillum frisingense]
MSEQNKLNGLQIARAFAALSIAYFHSWRVTMQFPANTDHPISILKNNGWVAVDFFFAISGFVICLVATKPNFRPFQFLTKRAFRLYPLLFVTSFIYLYLTHFVGRTERQTDQFFYYSLTLLPTDGFPFFDVAWSLQHEMAFYVLTSLIVPFGGVAGLIGAMLAGIALDHIIALPWYLHQLINYYPNFLIGIAVFLIHKRVSHIGSIIPFGISAVAFYLVVHIFNLPRIYYAFPLFFLLIAFLNIKSSQETRLGKLGSMLGDASYSMYLIHPLIFTYIYINLQPPLPPLWTQELIRAGAFIALCCIACASWFLLERPAMKLGDNVVGRIFRNNR